MSDIDKIVARLKTRLSNEDAWAVAPEVNALIASWEAQREALKDIAIYGCGMLSQPPAFNSPAEVWLKMRISAYEQRAHAALNDAPKAGETKEVCWLDGRPLDFCGQTSFSGRYCKKEGRCLATPSPPDPAEAIQPHPQNCTCWQCHGA